MNGAGVFFRLAEWLLNVGSSFVAKERDANLKKTPDPFALSRRKTILGWHRRQLFGDDSV